MTIVLTYYFSVPGDHTDRFSYWPILTRKGGEMIWPGTPNEAILVVDVLDLVFFLIV